CVPSGCSAPRGRQDLLDGDARGDQQPGDNRVGVPHLARPQLVPAPGRGRSQWHAIENALRDGRVVAERDRALYRFGHVRDPAVAPAANLVAKDEYQAEEWAADCAAGHSAMAGVTAAGDRGHLDHEAAVA